MSLAKFLVQQREEAGLTHTEVARRMGYPGGAIKAIEEGRRVPRSRTVYKYMNALFTDNTSEDMFSRFNRKVA